jgi:glycosyltransferase involved in cell wall biosynthesis
MNMNTNQLNVSFVLPCLNEAECVKECVEECFLALSESGFVGEVIVADNGSCDGSQKAAEQSGARVVTIMERGYGSAIRGGMKQARGNLIILGDCDGSYCFRELPRFVEKFSLGYEMIIGCRFPRGGGRIEPGAMPFLHRWLGNPVLSGIGRRLFPVPVRDFHCGLRGVTRTALQKLKFRCVGMEFASEMIIRAYKAELRIAEVPVTLRRDNRRFRSSHLRSFPDGYRHLRFLIQESFDLQGSNLLHSIDAL